jgi:hypothetical protein
VPHVRRGADCLGIQAVIAFSFWGCCILPRMSTHGGSTHHFDWHIELERWEIWYGYSCYLSQTVPNLRKAAIKLLAAKCARAVVLPEGEVGYRDGGEIKWCQMVEEDSIGSQSGSISFTGDIPEDESLRIPLLTAGVTRLASRNVFSFHAPTNDESIHVILPDLTVYLSETDPIPLTVTARIFQSGITFVTFRLRLASESMPLDSFIHNFVNLAMRPLFASETDKDLTFLFVDALTRKERFPFWKRPQALKLRRLVKEAFIEKTRRVAEDRNVELPSNQIWAQGSDTSQLSGLALEYIQALAYSLGNPRKGIPFLLLGEPEKPDWRGFWAGNPHIHLIRFAGQSPSAQENEERFGESFKWILARSAPREGTLRTELPKNTRVFDDFAVYVNEACVLWVYTSEKEDQGGSGTRDDPLYLTTFHHQVKGEFLEYGRILYKCLRHELNRDDLNWDTIFSIRNRQLQFELDLQETGQFGEIRDFLAEGLRARRVPELKEQNAELLSLRESFASVDESRRVTMTGIILGLLLSLLGIPGVIDFLNEYIVPHVSWIAALDKYSIQRTVILATFSILGILGLSGLTIFVLKRLRWISRKPPIERN